MPTQLLVEVRPALADEFEPRPQPAGWVLVAVDQSARAGPGLPGCGRRFREESRKWVAFVISYWVLSNNAVKAASAIESWSILNSRYRSSGVPDCPYPMTPSG